MKQVLVKINTVVTEHPTGTVGGDWLISVGNGEDIFEYIGAEPEHVFELEAGGYVVKAHRFDSDGNVIGAVLYKQFKVFEIPPSYIDTAGEIVIQQYD